MNAFGGISGRVLGAAVVSLSLGVGLVPGSAAARGTGQDGAAAPPPVRTVDPAKLRRGPDATIPYLQDGWIHSGGKRVRVRVPYTKGRQALLGRSGSAWVVASAEDGVRVHRIRSGRAPKLVRGISPRRGIRLSRGGAQILVSWFDRTGTNVRVHRMSDGKRVDWSYSYEYAQPADAADGHVLLFRDDDESVPFAADWDPGGGERRLGTGLNAGFLRQDVVFVQAGTSEPGSETYGPTSISSPGTPAWSARFAALAVSPDRQLVIGTGPRLVRKRAVLQVRRMSDGVVLQQFSYGGVIPDAQYWAYDQGEQTARFENDDKFVFQFSAAGRSRLVRCSTSGRCARASDAGKGITTSFEKFMW